MAKRIVDEEMRFSIIVNGNEAQKELYELEKSTRDLTKRNKELKDARTQLYKEGKRGTAQYKKLSQEIKENETKIKSYKTQMKGLQDQIGLTGLTMKQLSSRASRLKIELHNMIPGSADHNRLQAELKETTARMKELRAQSNSASKGLGGFADSFNRFAALGASVIATLTGIVFSAQKIIDYNGKLADSMSDVKKTTGLTNTEVEELAKSFGLLNTRTSRIDLLKIAEEGGRLGIQGVRNLKEYVEVANQAKVALGDDLSDEAIREVGKMTNVYSVGEKTGRKFSEAMLSLGSAINEVSATGANQAGYLVDYLKRQSGIAAQAKVSAEQNLGYAATFDEIGQSVEVSATAMNKVWMDMFENTGTYAQIAGMSLKDFNNLLETDSNEAMIKFLEGLNGNNEGLSIMIDKLSGLEVGGARGAQTLSALAANTDLLRQRQETASKALIEATSLTNEYDEKNNNLAATIEKVSKKVQAFFSSDFWVNALSTGITVFGQMIGAVKSSTDALRDQSRQAFENSKENYRLEKSGETLVSRYEELAKQVKLTGEEKEEMRLITYDLRDMFGKSVVSINEETGALILNTEAVRKQIKAKRMAADDEASTIASRFKNSEDQIKILEEQKKRAKDEFVLRQRYFEKNNKAQLEDIRNASGISEMQKQQLIERMEDYKKLEKARFALDRTNEDLIDQEEYRLELLKQLKDLNYTEKDVNNVFGSDDPEEGDTKIIDGQLFVFKDGRWQLKLIKPKAPKGTKSNKDRKLYDLEEQSRELMELRIANAEAEKEIFDGQSQYELNLLKETHQKKLQELRAQKKDEADVKNLEAEIKVARQKGDNKTADEYEQILEVWKERNIEINEQIEHEEVLHQIRVSKIANDAQTRNLDNLTHSYELKKTIRETAFNNELNGVKSLAQAKSILQENLSEEELSKITTLEEAKEELRKQFQIKELEEQAKHLQGLVSEMEAMYASGEFEGMDIDLLPEEQKQEMLQRLEQARYALSLLGFELDKLRSGESEGKGLLNGMEELPDLFGMTPSDWELMFENFQKSETLISAMTDAANILFQTWQAYSDYKKAGEDRDMAEYEQNVETRKAKQKSKLDQGLINERQYNRAVEQLEKEKERKKAELEYKQAKRQKQMALAQAFTSTALAVLNALQTQPFLPMGPIMAGVAAGMGALQIATIAKQPLPARGYEDGLYPVEREQDGKMFNAHYGGKSKTGIVDKPTLFLAGEQGKDAPEMIINGTDYSNFTPEFKDSLHREVARVKGYQDGFYNNSTKPQDFNNENNTNENSNYSYAELAAALNRNTEMLEYIKENPIQAYLAKNQRMAKEMQEEMEKYNQTRNNARQ